MKTRHCFWLACALLIVVVCGDWLRVQLRIDSGLDLGGRWNDERRRCEPSENEKQRSFL